MEHRNDYNAQRGILESSITATAKIIHEGDVGTIVLSPALYTSSNDTLTRLFTFLHEIIHLSNRSRFPKATPRQYSMALYQHNIYTLYDEYVADRRAYQAIDETGSAKSKIWEQSIAASVNGFHDILSDGKFRLALYEAVREFRIDPDLETFFPKVNSVFDVVAISITHLQAIMDQYPDYRRGGKQSYFMNDSTEALMASFGSHYEKHSYDLTDAIGPFVEFMKKFGVHFVEKDNTHYCHVLDIRENG
jgi:hypothetical protein